MGWNKGVGWDKGVGEIKGVGWDKGWWNNGKINCSCQKKCEFRINIILVKKIFSMLC